MTPFTRDKMRLKSIAHINPLTRNPGTIALTKRITIPLITNVNNPRVKILIGRVKIISIGLIIALIMPKTTATTIAVKKLSTFTPGKIYAEITTANALSTIFIIACICVE